MNNLSQKQCITREYYLRLSKDFHYPINLLQQVYDRQVVLEHIFTRNITIYGIIRVNNRSFDKQVFIRYTIDRWKTSSIIKAQYLIHYEDNNTDMFQFKLTMLKEKLFLPMNISFAICYRVNEEEFWDNNYSQNYNLDVIENTIKETTSILNQLSILHNDVLQKQIARDYHAIPNTCQQIGNLCGLKNLGGTCYMNSILQSLSMTSLLTDYFFSNEFKKKNGIIANEYLNLLYLLCSEKYKVITPIPFKQIIGYIDNIYLSNQQQDAHEFLIFLLDNLHQDLIRIKSNENQINNDSIIVDLFYGTYRSTITCLTCMKSSHSFEPFVCLTLPIPFINQCTLEDCLTYLNQEEYLTEDSKWFCSSCQYLCNAKKRLEIYRLPKILIIQLKRFQIDFEMKWIKNNTLVLYPEDNLNLHQYCSSSSSSSEQLLYKLYSAINHNGSLDDGHYTTFTRDNSSLWFEFDDEIINYISTDQVNPNCKAYLLFYMLK